ncbi:IS3 family transposase, partial [Frankia sp. CcWB3]
MPTEVAARLAELGRENRELRRANEILKSASAFRGGARPPAPVVHDYIDQNKQKFGVEPICAVLKDAGVQVAPSTYYAAGKRPPSARAVTDEETLKEIRRIHAENYGVSGARKVFAQLDREGGVAGRHVARCTVARLLRGDG